ncbi:MAG: hypothetical protein IJC35_06120 [Oscillospiraceae bacterium]|nr:hypothetical protein [Oscillospiraceae bacterium]
MKLYVNDMPHAVRENTVYTPPFLSVTSACYAVVNAEGPAVFRAEYPYPVTEACIRPLQSGIAVKVSGNTVSFEMTVPGNVSLEVNGGIEDALLLFFDIPEKEEIPEGYEVIRFAPGEHTAGILDITRDKTAVVFEEGAVVHGKIRARGVDGLLIMGHGTITMREIMRDTTDLNNQCVDIMDCRNVVVKQLLITDSCNWSFKTDNCEDMLIDNVRVLGYRSNNDGFDICGSRRVHVQNCFVRSFDDSVSVKGLNTGDIKDILVEKCVFWNDMARSMNVGSEISCDKAENIVFRNIDVIHNLTSYPICQVHNGDRGVVRNVVFEDIRVENAPNAYLFDLRIYSCYWNMDKSSGSIDGIHFRDIAILGEEGKDFTNLIARIEGKDDAHRISNVTMENITVFGKHVTSETECGIERIAYADEVRFSSAPKDFGLLEPKLSLTSPFVPGADGRYHGTVTLQMTNANAVPAEGEFFLKLAPKDVLLAEDTRTTYALQPGESFRKEYTLSAVPGKYLVQTASSKIGMKNAWLYFEVEGVLSETPVVIPMKDCHGNSFSDVRLSVQKGYLVVESELLRTTPAIIYTALPVPVEEEEVLFMSEECDWGEINAVKQYKGKPNIAYELGNPLEISLVYLNMPKTNITEYRMPTGYGYGMYKCPASRIMVPFDLIGIPCDAEEILLEIVFDADIVSRYRKTLFRSVMPEDTSHMYAKFRLKET